MSLEDLYSEIVISHYKNPLGAGKLLSDGAQATAENSNCGDEVQLSVKIGQKGKITDIRHQANGCIICKASASILAGTITGKQHGEATAIVEETKELINGNREVQEQKITSSTEYRALSHLAQYPTRRRCGLLAWEALEKILNKE